MVSLQLSYKQGEHIKETQHGSNSFIVYIEASIEATKMGWHWSFAARRSNADVHMGGGQ
jgi:hypothetical protein